MSRIWTLTTRPQRAVIESNSSSMSFKEFKLRYVVCLLNWGNTSLTL